jgi:hypothetical protein
MYRHLDFTPAEQDIFDRNDQLADWVIRSYDEAAGPAEPIEPLIEIGDPPF